MTKTAPSTTFPAIGARVTLTHYYIGNVYAGTNASPDFTVSGTVFDTPAEGAPYLSIDTDEIVGDMPEGVSAGDARIDGRTVYVAIGAFQEWTVTPAPVDVILIEEASTIAADWFAAHATEAR